MAIKMRPTNKCTKEKKKGKITKEKRKKEGKRPNMAIKMRQSTRQVQIEPQTKGKTRNIEGKQTKDCDQDEAHEQMQ